MPRRSRRSRSARPPTSPCPSSRRRDLRARSPDSRGRWRAGDGDGVPGPPGDALPLIAERYDVTVDDLVDANGCATAPSIRSIPATRCASPKRRAAQQAVTDERPDDGLGTMRIPAAVRCVRTAANATPTGSSPVTSSAGSPTRTTSRSRSWRRPTSTTRRTSLRPGQELWLPCEGEDLGTVPESTARIGDDVTSRLRPWA